MFPASWLCQASSTLTDHAKHTAPDHQLTKTHHCNHNITQQRISFCTSPLPSPNPSLTTVLITSQPSWSRSHGLPPPFLHVTCGLLRITCCQDGQSANATSCRILQLLKCNYQPHSPGRTQAMTLILTTNQGLCVAAAGIARHHQGGPHDACARGPLISSVRRDTWQLTTAGQFV